MFLNHSPHQFLNLHNIKFLIKCYYNITVIHYPCYPTPTHTNKLRAFSRDLIAEVANIHAYNLFIPSIFITYLTFIKSDKIRMCDLLLAGVMENILSQDWLWRRSQLWRKIQFLWYRFVVWAARCSTKAGRCSTSPPFCGETSKAIDTAICYSM